MAPKDGLSNPMILIVLPHTSIGTEIGIWTWRPPTMPVLTSTVVAAPDGTAAQAGIPKIGRRHTNRYIVL